MEFVNTFTLTEEAGSQIKLEGEIPFEELQKHRAKAIAHLGKNMEVAGFRKGNIPEKIVVAQVGEMAILGEMAERAIALAYPEALKHHKIDAIGYPQISITKLAEGNPLGFTAHIAVLPKITLPDVKKIAATVNKDKATDEVTDEEVETQIKDILRQKLAYEKLQSKAGQTHTHEDGTVHEGPAHDHEEVETHTHEDGTVHEGPAHDHEEPIDDKELPELTDEYVKTLGQEGQFESVDDFKAKIKEHLAIQKKQDVAAAHRATITDKILEETTLDLPQILIDSELEQMFGQMNEDLSRANLNMEDYLGHIKKTKEDLKKEWTPAAEKRAKLQLVLNEIAKKENVETDKAQLNAQVDQLMQQYKDADEARVRIYVGSVMQNEAVMKMLEEQN